MVGRTNQLGHLVDDLHVDEVLIALPHATRAELVEMVGDCQREGLSVRVYPDVFQLLAGEVQIGHLDGLPLLSMRDVALRGWRLTLKRGLDAVISAAVLVILSPLLLAMSVIIKIDSHGPAFFVQKRVGLDGRPFLMLKFRSMRTNAETDTGAVCFGRLPGRIRHAFELRDAGAGTEVIAAGLEEFDMLAAAAATVAAEEVTL